MTRLILPALLLAPMMVMAQQDSLATDSATVKRNHAIFVTAGPGGLKVGVENTDSTHRKDQSDTLRITTKRKQIRIITSLRTDIDTSESFNDRVRELRRERRNTYTYWAGLEYGMSTFLTSDGRIGDGPESGPLQLNNARSRFFAINFMEQKVEFGTHHAGLLTGLGLEFLNYKLSDNVSLAANGDSTYAVPMELPVLNKNKLRQIGLRVPLMLEFNTQRAKLPADAGELAKKPGWTFDRKRNFHLAFGVVGSWYFDTMYKQKYKEDGRNVKNRTKDDLNLLPYRLAARAQVGFASVNLFAEYALTPMFQEGTTPDMRALNFGITLVGFN
ncbi:MAG: hypothetical protein J5I62_05160 [Flavobacteriales bacterium]|nr:hypothetical protein [Flavobacteriales bacterium]MEB2341490.1 hypothetical protein [Flavobacteriia bacterium]